MIKMNQLGKFETDEGNCDQTNSLSMNMLALNTKRNILNSNIGFEGEMLISMIKKELFQNDKSAQTCKINLVSLKNEKGIIEWNEGKLVRFVVAGDSYKPEKWNTEYKSLEFVSEEEGNNSIFEISIIIPEKYIVSCEVVKVKSEDDAKYSYVWKLPEKY